MVANSSKAGSRYPERTHAAGWQGWGRIPFQLPEDPQKLWSGKSETIDLPRSLPALLPFFRRTAWNTSERRQHEPVLTSGRLAKPWALSWYLRPARAATLHPAFAIFCWQR